MKDRKLLSSELGRVSPAGYAQSPSSGVVVVLDNVRSAFNVGSVFRTSDAFRVDRICLCGICAVPPSAEIHKSALGAEEVVPWQYFADTLEAVESLRAEGYGIISVEQTVSAVSLEAFPVHPGARYALVLGNEVDGVRQDVVDFSDSAVVIPQWGTKHSLNISVAASIVLWEFRKKLLKL